MSIGRHSGIIRTGSSDSGNILWRNIYPHTPCIGVLAGVKRLNDFRGNELVVVIANAFSHCGHRVIRRLFRVLNFNRRRRR